jgi:hypothetical protein
MISVECRAFLIIIALSLNFELLMSFIFINRPVRSHELLELLILEIFSKSKLLLANDIVSPDFQWRLLGNFHGGLLFNLLDELLVLGLDFPHLLVALFREGVESLCLVSLLSEVLN